MKKHRTPLQGSIYFFVAAVLLTSIIAACIGVFDLPDSFFYLALGRYFYTKEIVSISPYNYTKPQTLFGPVYGLIFSPIKDLPAPWGAMLIPGLQTALLFLSTYMVYLAMRTAFSKRWSTIGAIIFILLPFNTLYATFILSENLTQFFIALYLLILSRLFAKKPYGHPAYLVGIASALTLTRYAYVLLLGVTTIAWIITSMRSSHSFRKKPIGLLRHIPAIIGLGLIFLWSYFNYQINGKWELSVFSGRHLYDNVVTQGKFLPAENDSTFTPFLKRIKTMAWMYMPWWDIQLIFNDGKISETKVDRMFFDISIAAIAHQPLAYATHVMRMAFLMPSTVPDHPTDMIDNLQACQNTACVQCVDKPWHLCWDKPLCEPAIKACAVQSWWAGWSLLNVSLYPIVTSILFVLAITGSLIALTKKSWFLRVVAGIFLLMHFFQAATEWLVGRFLIPLYPLYAVLIMFAVYSTYTFLAKIYGRIYKSKNSSHAR